MRVNREEQETEVRSREQLREKVMPVRGTDGDVDFGGNRGLPLQEIVIKSTVTNSDCKVILNICVSQRFRVRTSTILVIIE